MFSTTGKDKRKPLFLGAGILTILGAIWARLKDIEIALSLFELITTIKLGNNTMAYLDILIILILGGLVLGAIHLWYKSKDKKAKREHLIEILKEALEAQKNLSEKSVTLHIQDIKENFLKEIKEALKEDEINKDKILEKLDHDFTHHLEPMREYVKKINTLKSKLELHKTGAILDQIRADKINKEIKNELN